MARIISDPIRLHIVDADAETRTLIESLLTTHTGRAYVVEAVVGYVLSARREKLRAAEANA